MDTQGNQSTWTSPPRILLCALDERLAHAWEQQFDREPHIEVVRGSILRTSTTAIVSPANSFGYMDGGLDLIYSQHFGWELERQLREVILAEYYGELAVGQAVIVETGDDVHPLLISAPTMRVPMDVSATANAFLAFRAILASAVLHNAGAHPIKIESIACPGLGTGEGRMSPELCARQMRYAYDVVVDGRLERTGGLARAVRNHLWLIGQDDS